MRNSSKGSQRSGMTLVEVVVSMALVAMTLLCLWEGFNLAFLTNQRSEEEHQVATQAIAILEGLSDEMLQVLAETDVCQISAKEGAYGYTLQVQLLDQAVFEGRERGLYEMVLTIEGEQETKFYQIRQVVIR